jgi:hypothetical protein
LGSAEFGWRDDERDERGWKGHAGKWEIRALFVQRRRGPVGIPCRSTLRQEFHHPLFVEDVSTTDPSKATCQISPDQQTQMPFLPSPSASSHLSQARLASPSSLARPRYLLLSPSLLYPRRSIELRPLATKRTPPCDRFGRRFFWSGRCWPFVRLGKRKRGRGRGDGEAGVDA